MTDFESWFRRPLAPVEVELPEGITAHGGVYFVDCHVCARRCELPVGIDEIPMVGYQHYGNCGPSCCP